MKNKYVSDSNNKENNNIFSKLLNSIKDVYGRVDSKVWLSLVFKKILIMIPIMFLSFVFVFAVIAIFIPSIENLIGKLTVILMILSISFYPYTLYWFSNTFIANFFNDLSIFGSVSDLFFRKIKILLGQYVLAGILSPIVGPIVWLKFKRDDMFIVKESFYHK